MNKKKVAIYVELKDWKEIRKKALELELPAGEYLVNLHKGYLSGDIISKPIINPKLPAIGNISEPVVISKIEEKSVSGKFFKPQPKKEKK